MSQTAANCDQCPLPQLVFHLQAWNNRIFPQVRENLVLMVLPFTLYGIFFLLCGASIYSLIQHSNHRTRFTTLVLSLAILVLFCSTTVYIVANFFSVQATILTDIIYNGLDLWGVVYIGEVYPVGNIYGVNLGQFPNCASTGALTINVLLGDAIVCWRACVLWQRNRGFMGTCILLLLTTFALATVDSVYTCSLDGLSSWQPDPHAVGNGSLFQGTSYGLAATALSLITNLFATLAVAFKAWQSRRTLKPYLVMGPMASQVEKLFSLLVESGVVYCALWVLVVAWQVTTYAETAAEGGFLDIFGVIMKGALVPLIAIYPTVIIVLVALNRSHVENGLMKSSSSQITLGPLALPPLSGVVNATVTTHHDSQSKRDTETVLAIGDGFPCGDRPEGSSTHIADEEQKPKEMI